MTPALLAKLPRAWPPAQPRPDWHRDPALAPALAACRAATRAHATSFFFASRLLPEQKKCAAYGLYAFCRWVDDSIDEAAAPVAPDAPALRAALDSMLAGRGGPPFAPAFAAVCREYGLTRELCWDLIEGCARDRLPVRLADLAELEVYCYHVASVVGLLMSRIFGLRDPAGLPRAVEMGLAMQLTNILRDVREDYERGRIYLPAEDLARFGVTEDQLRAGRVDARWTELLRFEIARARAWYVSAELGLPLLDNDGSRLTATVMGRLYAGILGAIERRRYDVFSTRCHVPAWRKCVILVRCLGGT
ncbi:MAG: phytoene/squalene synthase family protein [Opitutales bacterium]